MGPRDDLSGAPGGSARSRRHGREHPAAGGMAADPVDHAAHGCALGREAAHAAGWIGRQPLHVAVVFDASWDGGPRQVYSERLDAFEATPLALPPGSVTSVSSLGEIALILPGGVLARAPGQGRIAAGEEHKVVQIGAGGVETFSTATGALPQDWVCPDGMQNFRFHLQNGQRASFFRGGLDRLPEHFPVDNLRLGFQQDVDIIKVAGAGIEHAPAQDGLD